jgi:hypothetical protein
MRRNPGFDGNLAHKIEDGVVTALEFSTLQATDISPVRALAGLQQLFIGNYPRGKSSLGDLSPLKGLPLVWLDFSGTKVSDLTPLTGMKLQYLYAMETAVSDLAALREMPLAHLDLHQARRVTSIKMLEGMPLEYLNLTGLNVADLSVLRGMTSLQQPALIGSVVACCTRKRCVSPASSVAASAITGSNTTATATASHFRRPDRCGLLRGMRL